MYGPCTHGLAAVIEPAGPGLGRGEHGLGGSADVAFLQLTLL